MFEMAGRVRIPSARSIFDIYELRDFWPALNDAGFELVDEVPRSVDKLLQFLTKERAEKVIKIVQSYKEVFR